MEDKVEGKVQSEFKDQVKSKVQVRVDVAFYQQYVNYVRLHTICWTFNDKTSSSVLRLLFKSWS